MTNFRRSDLAAFIEALQVTLGNLETDFPDLLDWSVAHEIVQDLWDVAESGQDSTFLLAWLTGFQWAIPVSHRESFTARVRHIYKEVK